MKRKHFLMLFALLSLTILKAQNSVPNGSDFGTISGKIVEKKTNAPIPYATITVKEEGKVVSGAITKENGTFTVDRLPLKTVTLEIQFMGFKKYTESITLSAVNKNASLKTISLEEEATQLSEVTVVKERSSIEQKIDKKVVTVGKDLVASGTNASEIMNNIPTVSIDPQTKELSLRGNSNVKVLVDGKPTNIDPAQLLQQIPSTSIKQIELITNPSAKYNPEGMSGIINIILHKNANTGFNGSVNTGVTFAKSPKVNSALNLNYKVGSVNMYANYGFNHGKNANHGFVDAYRNTFENSSDFLFNTLNTSHSIKIGLDYYITDKNTLSVFTNQNLNNGKGTGSTIVDFKDNTTVFIDDNPNNPNPIDLSDPTTYFTRTNSDTKQLFFSNTDTKTHTYDFVFKHDFDKKDKTLELQGNFSKTKDLENTLYEYPYVPTSNTNDVAENTNYSQFNLDFTNPLTETTKLELGAESRMQTSTYTLLNLTPVIPTSSNSFDFDRNIYSVYGNYSKQWKKWSAQVGVRLEDYKINATFVKTETSPALTEKKDVEDKIFAVYPSAFLTYTLDDKNSFNFNVSRRVDRPSINQISPIREWSTPYMESRGNPDLHPQFTNSFEINYTRNSKLGSFTSGIFYRQINDEISRVIYNNPEDLSGQKKILSFNNFDKNNAYGIEFSANLKFNSWWSVNASTDAYFKTVKGTVQNVVTNQYENTAVDVTSFNARLNNTFKATKDLRFILFGMYRGSEKGLQFTRSSMYKTDLGASYNILKGKGSITVRFNDMFNTMHFAFDGEIPYKQVGAFYWESQSFYAGFNYAFGGGKNKALQRKQRDANEVQGGGGMF